MLSFIGPSATRTRPGNLGGEFHKFVLDAYQLGLKPRYQWRISTRKHFAEPSLVQSNYSTPPAHTVEISIFGSVIGEAIVIHLSPTEWIIVDSCLHAESQKPAAIHYLEAMGLDPGAVVKLIVLTHWHDDHVTGAAKIVERCEGAALALPQAMSCDEYIQFLSTYAKPDFVLDRETSPLKEFKQIARLIQERVNKNIPFAHPNWAAANKLLFKTFSGSVIALSPSNTAIAKSQGEFAHLIAEGRESRRVPVAPDRNENAVALWLASGEYRVLLGSDLQESTRVDDGWQAAITCKHFPDGVAGTFKIPHHGSNNAHSDKVWTNLVRTSNAVAAITTYIRGRAKLPKSSDIARLKRKTNAVYCTTPLPEAAPKRDPTVERTMKEMVVDRRVLKGRTTGHVRIRVDTSNGPPYAEQVDLFGAATLLT